MPDTPPTTAERLLLTGPDARSFAHGQFTSQVDALPQGHWQFSAWLDALGRVRALFHLARLADDQLLLVLRGGQAAPLAEQLKRFQFRAKLRIEALPPLPISEAAALPLHQLQGTADALQLGCGDYSLRLDALAPDQPGAAWRQRQIEQGWPWLPADALDQLLPPWLALEHLSGVAFDKGCYPGQEIVARLHFRGGNKRHLHRLQLSAPADAGGQLRLHDRDVGMLLDVYTDIRHGTTTALAVLTDEARSSFTPDTISTAQGITVSAIDAHWPD